MGQKNNLGYYEDDKDQMYIEVSMGPSYPDSSIRLTKVETNAGRTVRIRKHHKTLFKGVDVQIEAVPELIEALVKIYGDFNLPKIIR